MSSRPVIAFITGGYSRESVISYQSAVTIDKNLDHAKYEVYKIDITPAGWYYLPADTQEAIEVDKNSFSIEAGGKKIRFDAVFIGIHGTPGEDGKMQGYFDLLNLPYTSCDAATSALTFNKRYTVAVAAFAGIHVARSLHIFKHQPVAATEVAAQLQLPVFVKPNNGGSSIGMSKVTAYAGLEGAFEKAFREDDQILVEEFISGREVTVGVFRSQGRITVLPMTEIVSKKDFFDYEAKYTAGMSEELTPAPITEEMTVKIKAAAIKVYEVFNCSGVVRIDFIYNEERAQPYLLEINTVPGQSEASIVPQMVRAMGWTLKDFYTALLEDALARRS